MVGTEAALSSHGQPVDSDCPYQPSTPAAAWKPPKGLAVFRRRSRKAAADFAAIEGAIKAGHVPVLGIALPVDFHTPSPPWVLPSDGTNLGLHAIAGVGLGSIGAKRFILVRNSWGITWGDRGHAWIDHRFVRSQVKEVLVLTTEVVP